jgi:hypothetical protein
MSLTVSPELLDRARRGDVDDAAFIACIQASLPYAWQLVSGLAEELRTTGADLADNQLPPDEAARGRLLRMMASDAMRVRRTPLRRPPGLPELPSPRRVPA